MTLISPQDGTVIVTGAGVGLGRALAVEFCDRGYSVLGIARNESSLSETAALCAEGLFQGVPADVADTTQIRGLFSEIGKVSVLVNNAAVYPHRDILEETSESFMQTVEINLGGVFNASNAALEHMVQTGEGRILNVSTFADIAPLPTAAAYSVSKGAVRILTRAMIADLGDRFPDIVIGEWMPGMLATRMGVEDGLTPEVAAKWGVSLALDRDPDLMGTVFEMDREILPSRGLKGKVKDLLMMRRRTARRL